MDDEPSIVKLLTEMLRQEGYRVLGARAVKKRCALMDSRGIRRRSMRYSHARNERLWSLLRLVREKHPGTASVMVTGEGDVRVGVQAMKEGADDYLLKPLNFDTVLASVKQVLERKKLEA